MSEVALYSQQAGQSPRVAGHCVRLTGVGVDIMIPISYRQGLVGLLLLPDAQRAPLDPAWA